MLNPSSAAKPPPAPVPRPLAEWHDDDGAALWWRFPIEEPPYVGDPRDDDFPDYVTHWTPLGPLPSDPSETEDPNA